MIIKAFEISFIITAIYFSFQEGNVFGWLKIWVNNKLPYNKSWEMIQKPIWDCLPCMGFWWTALIIWHIDFQLMFMVAGINVIISKFINWE